MEFSFSRVRCNERGHSLMKKRNREIRGEKRGEQKRKSCAQKLGNYDLGLHHLCKETFT